MTDARAERLRREDPDRFLASLFAPPQHREALWVLHLFALELGRARLVASNPLIAQMRLQWWREVVEGAPRRHETATPLSRLLDAGALDRAALLGMIDARDAEIDTPPDDDAAWEAHLRATSGGLAAEAGRLLGADGPTRARLAALGAAYAAATLRPGLAAALLAEGRGRFPRAVIAAALPGVLARRDLRGLRPRGIGAKAAVLWAALTARV